jgi:hypothetical protein
VTRTGPIGAAALAALLLAGCAGSTVVGQGVALHAAGTTSQAAPASGFPSTSAPAGSSVPSGAPAGHGVLVTYPAGHFAVVMPTQATERSEPGSLGGASFTVHLAVSVSSGNMPTEVGSEDIDPPLDPADYQLTMRAAISTFSGSSGSTVNSQTATQFRGYVARRASVTTPDGNAYTLMLFMYSPARLYIVFASDGATYDQVTMSLRLLP